jgi:hypothetical protein
MSDTQRHSTHKRISGALEGKNPPGVVIQEQELVVQLSEAAVVAAAGMVMRAQVAGGEARCYPKGGTDVHRQPRCLDQWGGLFPGGLGQLVATAGAHVETHVAQQIKGRLKALVRIALIEETYDVLAALGEQGLTQSGAGLADRCAVLLREVQRLEFRVDRDKAAADPGVELFGVLAHGCSVGVQVVLHDAAVAAVPIALKVEDIELGHLHLRAHVAIAVRSRRPVSGRRAHGSGQHDRRCASR